METRYFSPKELSDYVTMGNLAPDLITEQTIARCSISDFIDLCESQKKRNSSLLPQKLLERFESFAEGPALKGLVFVAELDRETLSKTLFVTRNPTTLWPDAASRQIPPLHSVRRLTLKDTEWGFWEETVYMEMEDFFSEQ